MVSAVALLSIEERVRERECDKAAHFSIVIFQLSIVNFQLPLVSMAGEKRPLPPFGSFHARDK